MGAEDDAPKEGGSGGKDAGGFLGLKPAGVKPSASGSKEQKASGAEKRWGVGDRAPKPEDPSKPKEPEKSNPKAEIAIKPLFQAQYGEGAWASTQEGADDKTFVTALAGKASAEAIGGSFDVKAKKGKLTLFKAKAEGTLVHGQIDLVEAIGNFLFGKKPTPPAPPSGPMTPMAARVLDLTAHGVPFVPGPGSTNVFIESMPALRATMDQLVCAAPGATAHGGGPALLGEPTVFINSMPAVRVGDYVLEPTGGPNLIVQGALTVCIGSPAPAPPPVPKAKAKDELPWVIFDSVAKGDVGAADAEGKIEGSVDLSKGSGSVGAQLGASAALLKGELPLKMRIRIPFTSAYVGLGVTASGTLGSAGLEAGFSAKVNEKNEKTGQTTWFAVGGGAGAHLGVGGASLKFSVDVSGK
jgi:uncharacterized Zn-binding protein involved in type VI secretion